MNKTYQKECASSIEYILPDYMGDIKKILSVSAFANPTGKFASEGAVTFSGTVFYEVLYADADDVLTKISASSDYEFKQSLDGGEYIDSAIEPRVSASTIRLSGPRKANLSANVSAILKIKFEDELTPSGDAFTLDAPLESVSEKIRIESSEFVEVSEKEFRAEAERLSGILADDIDVITTSGSVNIFESEPRDDGLLVRGELIITAIIKTDELPPFAIKKAIPFEELITVSDFESDGGFVRGYVRNAGAGVADEEGEAVLSVFAVVDFAATLSKNEEISVVKDAYLPSRDTEGEYSLLSYEELYKIGNFACNVETKFDRASLGLENARDILMLRAVPSFVETTKSANGAKIEGELSFTGVACEIKEDSTPDYIPIKCSSPFADFVNLNCQYPDNSVLECRITSAISDASFNEGEAIFKTALSLEYRVYTPKTVTRMSECSLIGEREYSKSSSEIRVYYPNSEETLFSVAKKYHTTSAKIAEDNGLTVEASTLDSKISIPHLIIK